MSYLARTASGRNNIAWKTDSWNEKYTITSQTVSYDYRDADGADTMYYSITNKPSGYRPIGVFARFSGGWGFASTHCTVDDNTIYLWAGLNATNVTGTVYILWQKT